MEADTRRTRAGRPFVFTSLKTGEGAESVADFIVSRGGLPPAKPEVQVKGST
jgi:urease accessory protein